MRLGIIWALLAPFFLANCATVVEGTDQNVLVLTDPDGATCLMRRDGVEIAAVQRTPASARVSKSKDPIEVTCKLDGHIDTTGYLQSGFQGMTFGNILLGGLIGVAIDAGSGAMHEYPENIKLVMPPEEFESIAARDAFFERQAATVKEEAEAAKEAIVANCTDQEGENKGCKSQQAKVDAQMAEKLEALERQKRGVRVKGQT